MRIVASTLQQAATHHFSRREESGSEVRTRVVPPRLDRLERTAPADRAAAAGDADAEDQIRRDPKLAALIDLVERLTGREVEVLDPSEMTGEGDRRPATRPQRAGWSVSIDAWRRIDEQETTNVSIRATVTDDSGATHDVALDLRMDRRLVQEDRLSIRAGSPAARDPLVLTLDGGAARFGDATMTFDLDLDDVTDRVRVTAGASAYLVRDADGNGGITDGSELFGARTGDGFAELAALDDDRNGWIDEGDAAFGSLSLAGPDGTLRSLSSAGVGAISVRPVESPFRLTDGTDRTVGQIRSTGLVLRDDGGAGTVQHVDLVI